MENKYNTNTNYDNTIINNTTYDKVNNVQPVQYTINEPIKDNDEETNDEYTSTFTIGIIALAGGLIIGGVTGFISGYPCGFYSGLNHSEKIKKLIGL